MSITADPNLRRQYLVEMSYYSEALAGLVWEYLATRDVVIAAGDPTAANRQYDGRVTAPLQMKREMFSDGALGGRALPSYSAIAVANDQTLLSTGRLAAWRAGGFDGRQVRVLQGFAGSTIYADHAVLLDGVGGGANSYGLSEIQIQIADRLQRLASDIQTATYGGAGGFDGGDDLKGKVRPDLFGSAHGVEPVPVDPANLWYDLAHAGLHSVSGVWDGGVALTADAGNPPAAGKYYVDTANGRIRLGTQPTYRVTVDARGAFGSDALTVADIISALVQDRLGLSWGDLDAAAFAALNTANSAAVGYYTRERIDGLAVLDALAGSVGAYYTATRAGKLTVGRLEAPTATAATDSQVALLIDDTDLEKGSLKVRPEGVPPYRIEIGCTRNWAPHQASEIAGAASAARRAFLLEEYRVEAAERADTQTKHLSAGTFRRNTLLEIAASAAIEAARLRDLIAVHRTTIDLTLQTQPFVLELGQEVWLASDLYAVTGSFRVVAIDENARDSRVTLTLWG